MTSERRRLIGDVGAEISALVASARSVTSAAAAAFAAGDESLSPSAFHVARWLDAFGAARPTEIASGLGMDKAAVSRAIVHLERAGLVRRTPHPSDARVHAVSLTRKGSRRIRNALSDKGAELRTRLARFDDDELRVLAELLHRLNTRSTP